MGYHTYDPSKADRLEDAVFRYHYLSAEELLWGLSPSDDDVVADMGSGTGFYTDDVAPYVSQIRAVDVQEEMHDYYREKGVPENVDLVTTGIENLPFESDSFDSVFSTMTYHEFANDESLEEIRRVTSRDGRVVIADWSSEGNGERGPPLDERFSLEEAVSSLREHAFGIGHEAERRETFFVVAE